MSRHTFLMKLAAKSLISSGAFPDWKTQASSLVPLATEIFENLQDIQTSNGKPPICLFHLAYLLQVLYHLPAKSQLPQQYPQLFNSMVQWALSYRTPASFDALLEADCTCTTDDRLRALPEPFETIVPLSVYLVQDVFDVLYSVLAGTDAVKWLKLTDRPTGKKDKDEIGRAHV